MDTLEVSVEPVDILVNLDSPVIKNLKISPSISGTLADGYDFVSSSVKPDQIQVEGPASLIDNISEIATEPIDVSGRYSDFSLLSNLANPGRFFTLRGDTIVEYRAEIQESSIQQLFPGININAVGLNENFTAKILPETGGITLRGSYAGISAFTPNEKTLVVDCSAITTEGSFELPVTAGGIDSGDAGSADSTGDIKPLEIYAYQPEKVTVEITKRAANG
jgi:hypothetical protein